MKRYVHTGKVKTVSVRGIQAVGRRITKMERQGYKLVEQHRSITGRTFMTFREV